MKSSASEWRIELAGELSRAYSAHEQVRMIVLGGSPSRGLSDEYSDVDMVVYWEHMDDDFIRSHPLKECGGDLKLFLDNGSKMELYYFDTLIFEVGHVTCDEWKEMTDSVLVELKADPGVIKSIGGFLDSVPLYGEAMVRDWKERLSAYPPGLAVKIVQRNLAFFWHGCIENQGLKRGELVFFYDGLCYSMKRITDILAAMNRLYFTAMEPRWIDYTLSRMTIKPANVWERMLSILDGDRSLAVGRLEELIGDVVALVVTHMPDVDVGMFRQSDALEIRACLEKPAVIRTCDRT